MAKIPNHNTLADQQSILVAGPNGITSTYQYDNQTRSLQRTDCGEAVSCKHGNTHIGDDKIPDATCDSPGLMSADDKCRLDAFTGTRIGVFGFIGSGMPDDGGFLEGDVILAAGSDFITLERVGNIIRWNVEIPVPLRCGCDSCDELFLVQDTTDIDKVRPSNCSGRVPGMNLYNSFATYLVPRSATANATDIDDVLSQKDRYPAMIFKRYNDQPGLAEFQLILKRTSASNPATEVGWSMMPNQTGLVTNVFAMGRDTAGNLMRFSFVPDTEPGLLGGMFYKGHLITKKMAVVTGYTPSVIDDNRYNLREWDVVNSVPLKTPFTARNIWEFENPENATSGSNPQKLKRDANTQLLPIGTLVELWAFQVGSTTAGPTYRYFFSKSPQVDPSSLWIPLDSVSFGDELISRDEDIGGTGGIAPSILVSDVRTFEHSNWGLTGYDDPLIYDTIDASNITGGGYDVNPDSRARVDINVPGLVIDGPGGNTSASPVRPIFLWYRANQYNNYFKVLIGRPDNSDYTPIDILFRSPVDSWSTKYAFVTDYDTVNNIAVVSVCGLDFTDIPPFGTLRNLTPGSRRDNVFNFSRKIVSMQSGATGASGVTGGYGCSQISLVGYEGDPLPTIQPGDVLELTHQDYDSQVLRLNWEVEPASNIQRIQFSCGTLNTAMAFDRDGTSVKDDFVRGMNPGYTVSSIYSQAGFWSGISNKPQASLPEFSIVDGGAVIGGAKPEYWNELEVMIRDGQLWIWWNKLLMPPDPNLNESLQLPVTINTPFYPIKSGRGKLALRMFPGTRLREVQVQSQARLFNEFTNGNIKIV